MKKVLFALFLSAAVLSGCSAQEAAASSTPGDPEAGSVFSGWTPAWQSRTAIRSNCPQSLSDTNSAAETSATGLTPETFGAVGDGVHDDFAALTAAAQAASQKGLPLELTAGATYRFSSCLELPSSLTIHGNGAVLLSDIQYETLWDDRPAVYIGGESNTNRAHDVRLENIVFRAADSCQTNTQLRLMRTRNIAVVHCTFDCDINDWNRGVADVYGANEDIFFQDDIFRQLSASESGGLWVRSWTSDVESRNIQFLNCDFYKAGGDEVLAVWGWKGVVRDVLISGCNFYQVDDGPYRERGFYPDWGITLGQSGETYVRMEDCTVRFNRCETLFRMVGDQTHAVVDNCTISMEQPEDFPTHDFANAANPMLAQGNDRTDGSTVFQNCRVDLQGDSGRRICYQVSTLKNNAFYVNLGLGVTRTYKILGNKFFGTMKNGVFWGCGTVQDNTIVARTSSDAWLSDGNFAAENDIRLDVSE